MLPVLARRVSGMGFRLVTVMLPCGAVAVAVAGVMWM